MFTALSFLKSKLRNKLDKNVDNCLILYVTKYGITNFPFNRALALRQSNYERRGELNITNVSNELDTEHNVLEAHNDISSTKVHDQNAESEGQHENWEFDIPQDII